MKLGKNGQILELAVKMYLCLTQSQWWKGDPNHHFVISIQCFWGSMHAGGLICEIKCQDKLELNCTFASLCLWSVVKVSDHERLKMLLTVNAARSSLLIVLLFQFWHTEAQLMLDSETLSSLLFVAQSLVPFVLVIVQIPRPVSSPLPAQVVSDRRF